MRRIPKYAPERFIQATLHSLRNGARPVRLVQVLDRMTDEQLVTVDISAVMVVIGVQQGETPIGEIPAEWWAQVMEGARI